MSRFVLFLTLLTLALPLSAQRFRRTYFPGGAAPRSEEGWKLVFHDEFLSETLDTGKWITYYPYGPEGSDQCAYCRTHGEEGQVYRDENVIAGSGALKLLIKSEATEWMGEQRAYTSGMIHSKDALKFKYGRFEIRCRLPKGMGFWPAFWLYGWSGNEIDVFELGMQDPGMHYTNIHKETEGRHLDYGDEHEGPDYSDNFHIFSVEWDHWNLKWMVDGRVVREMPRFPALNRKSVQAGKSLNPGKYRENLLLPDWPLHLIANVAVGVTGITPFTGSPASTTVMPNQMLIDYIRVYQRTNTEEWPDLCGQRRIEGPDIVKGPVTFRFSGPYAQLKWEAGPGLSLDRQSDNEVQVTPASLPLPAGAFIRVWVDDTEGPCPPEAFTIFLKND